MTINFHLFSFIVSFVSIIALLGFRKPPQNHMTNSIPIQHLIKITCTSNNKFDHMDDTFVELGLLTHN
jgi:hypothetical protein